MAGDWFRGTPGAAPDALRLFCFPHAGGAASFFREWRERLLPEIDVCPIQLAGRESRAKEPFCTRPEELVRDLVTELARWQDRPYAVLGHSLGAAIAHDVVHGLSAAGVPSPRALIVSGRRSPYADRRSVRTSSLPDEAFVAALVRLGGLPAQLLGRTEMYKFFLPVLRADFVLDENYRPPGPPPGLQCPVLAVTGVNDPLAAPADLVGWRVVSTGAFAQQEFPGDHFYLRSPPEELLQAIREQVVPG